MKRTLLTLLLLLATLEVWAVTPDVRDELNRGRVLERGGNQAEALAIYEKIFAEHPEYQPVFPSLRNAYMKAGMYDKLIEACTLAEKIRPKDTSIYMALGEAWAAKGEEDKAGRAWEKIIDLNPENRNYYNLAGYEFTRHEMHDDAVRVYEMGEKVIGEHTFARELSRIHERTGDFSRAADEVLNILFTRPNDVLGVERELKRLLSRSGGSTLIMETVKARATKGPQPPQIHRVLGDLYLLQGDYESALSEYARSDAEEPLWELGLKAEKEGLHDAALSSYRAITERKGPYATPAQFRIGTVLEASEKYDLAVEAYKEFIHDFPTDSQAAQAKFRIGMVRLRGLSDAAGALVYFKGLAEPDSKSELALNSRYMIAECNLRLGKLDEAVRELELLMKASPSDRALYLLGEATYYQGDFDSSLVLSDRLADEYRNGDLVNDALSRSVFISANSADPKVLHRYAGIQRMVYSNDLDQALVDLKLFLNEESTSSLADDAVLLLGDILEKRGSYNESIGAYRDLINLHPESKLKPEARRRIAELFAVRLNNEKAAIDELEQILIDHPDYVLTAAVRNRIEDLKKSEGD